MNSILLESVWFYFTCTVALGLAGFFFFGVLPLFSDTVWSKQSRLPDLQFELNKISYTERKFK